MSRIDSDDDNDIIQFCLFPRLSRYFLLLLPLSAAVETLLRQNMICSMCAEASSSPTTMPRHERRHKVGREPFFSSPDFCHVRRVTSFNSLSLNCPHSSLLTHFNFYTAASVVPAGVCFHSVARPAHCVRH